MAATEAGAWRDVTLGARAHERECTEHPGMQPLACAHLGDRYVVLHRDPVGYTCAMRNHATAIDKIKTYGDILAIPARRVFDEWCEQMPKPCSRYLPRGGELMPTSKRSQAYYWTPEWQAGEREAEADIAAGRVPVFGTVTEAVRWLLDDDPPPTATPTPVTYHEMVI